MRRAYALGLMRAGYLLEWSNHEHAVNNTVSWSKTLIEGLYLGADWNFKCRALEYAAPAQTGAEAVTTFEGDLGTQDFIPLDSIDGFPAGGGTVQVTLSDGSTTLVQYTGLFAITLDGVSGGQAGQNFNVGARVALVTVPPAGVPEAAWPWGSYNPTNATPEPAITPKLNVAAGQVGQRYTGRSGILALTVVSGTPARGTPTAFQASQAVNRRGNFNYDSRLRETPLEFLLLPYTMPAGSTESPPAESPTADSVVTAVTSSLDQSEGSFVTLEDATGFPQGGGTVIIDSTIFHYDSVQGNQLFNVVPAQDGAHTPQPGDDIQLLSADPVAGAPALGEPATAYGRTVWFLTF